MRSPTYATGFNTGKVGIDISLGNRFQLFDPDDPARYQWFTELKANYAINKNWSVLAGYSFDIENNFDESERRVSTLSYPKFAPTS